MLMRMSKILLGISIWTFTSQIVLLLLFSTQESCDEIERHHSAKISYKQGILEDATADVGNGMKYPHPGWFP